MRIGIGARCSLAYPRRVNPEQRHVVYISRLAPGRDCMVFGSICLSARTRNVEWGISGVLLFDGERFLQWLCGPPEKVARLMEAIVADLRHVDLRVLLEAQLPAGAGAAHWRSGFVDADALDAFAALGTADHGALLDALAGLVAQADLDPVPAPQPPALPSTGGA